MCFSLHCLHFHHRDASFSNPWDLALSLFSTLKLSQSALLTGICKWFFFLSTSSWNQSSFPFFHICRSFIVPCHLFLQFSALFSGLWLWSFKFFRLLSWPSPSPCFFVPGWVHLHLHLKLWLHFWVQGRNLQLYYCTNGVNFQTIDYLVILLFMDEAIHFNCLMSLISAVLSPHLIFHLSKS